ncbi:2-desacetyl-2-hydroxyethyl bacteriochlorophyllide A dehydrogenase [Natranaerovirga hydrolytica]|uniref:2-desacetyl-2-hydroxyethyl bacteriochlorophyllide A dehydrogenase n=1 Tax=Natranaerovirga hydrolytica TaxID=680378 RepID=A0A4R1MPH0_9FIRM|nr:zinc-binding alcohol dehydrogenase family protein [Natranaerovirga hydrolytica]TCK92369.1 2-desacetyl-2-hydroxyethyl bacteriochlorophyllide A dehydrogenase [Natranaerovirga hydrolytica]
MKTIYINEPGKIEVKNKEIPKPKKGEALLKLLYGGICGSDLGTYRGTFAYVSYPRIPGHEFSAEIVSIPENDLGLKEGMIVTCNPYFNCGSCYSCKKGQVNCCTTNQTMGVQRDGAFSEYITMPIDRIYDGKGLDAKTLTLIEPFCISYHGVTRAKVKKGDKVLIVGAGTIGVLAAVAAKMFGATVYMCDIAESKLEYAKNFNIDGTIVNTSSIHFQEHVNRITDGNGFDVTIEAVGLPSTFQNCIDAVAFSGRVVLIGVGKQNIDFNFTMIQKKELNVYGSRNAQKKDFVELIDLVKNGNIDLEKIITDEFNAEDFAKAMQDFDRNGANMLKVVVKF